MRNWQFFAAHEHFEAASLTAYGDAKALLRVLAQIAASHQQLTLGRGRAAVRTWHKARSKLHSLDIFERNFEHAMDALHRALGLDEHAPRFFDVGALAQFPLLPVPDALTDQTPIA